MKSDVCYIQDPEAGKFMGSKPGCSHSGAEVSQNLLQRFEKEKGVIKQRVDVGAAAGTLTPKDSELKGKAEQLLYKLKTGALSYQEGLYELSKGNAPLSKYAKAEILLDRDTGYWRDILKKGGSDQVDTLLTSFVGAPLTGVADYVLNASDAKSGVQHISDQKHGLPSGKTPQQVKTEHDKWRKAIKKRALDYNKYKDMFTDDKYTKVDGNTIDTRATLYG